MRLTPVSAATAWRDFATCRCCQQISRHTRAHPTVYQVLRFLLVAGDCPVTSISFASRLLPGPWRRLVLKGSALDSDGGLDRCDSSCKVLPYPSTKEALASHSNSPGSSSRFNMNGITIYSQSRRFVLSTALRATFVDMPCTAACIRRNMCTDYSLILRHSRHGTKRLRGQ